jgi:hypothetical protein
MLFNIVLNISDTDIKKKTMRILYPFYFFFFDLKICVIFTNEFHAFRKLLHQGQ